MGQAYAHVSIAADEAPPAQNTLKHTRPSSRGDPRGTSKAVLDHARETEQGDPNHSPGKAGAGRETLSPETWQQNVDKLGPQLQ